MLQRTAVLVSAAGDVEARFTVGLPAPVAPPCCLCARSAHHRAVVACCFNTNVAVNLLATIALPPLFSPSFISATGQHVLERTAVLVSTAGDVEARFTVGLPAQGRSIMGPWAGQILTQHLARCGGSCNFTQEKPWSSITAYAEQDHMQRLNLLCQWVVSG